MEGNRTITKELIEKASAILKECNPKFDYIIDFIVERLLDKKGFIMDNEDIPIIIVKLLMICNSKSYII